MRGWSVIVALLVGTVTPGPAAAAVLRVTPSTAPSCSGATFHTVQSALDAAHDGDVIEVCPGTYAEQLTVTRRVTVRGVGTPTIAPVGMTANTTDLQTGGAVAAVAVIRARATLRGLRIDAGRNEIPNCNPGMPSLVGIFLRNTSATLWNNLVMHVDLDDQHRDCDTGTAILAQTDGATRAGVSIRKNSLNEYQRAGIVANGAGLAVAIRGNTIVGAVKFVLPQNGIQVGFGARARVVRNEVSLNAVPVASANCEFDAGDLLFQTDGGLVARNTFTGNTAGIAIVGAHNRVVHNTLDGLYHAVAFGLDGIAVFGDRNLVQHNTVRNMSAVGIRLAGMGNRAVRNTVSATHTASLCAAYRALFGCAPALTTCGVGMWVAGGSNQLVHNTLASNDTDLQDDGASGQGASNFVPVR